MYIHTFNCMLKLPLGAASFEVLIAPLHSVLEAHFTTELLNAGADNWRFPHRGLSWPPGDRILMGCMVKVTDR